MKDFDLIAILGRGIQMLDDRAPTYETSSWHLTEDLEIWLQKGGHPPVRVPADDENPLCMVGGGELNMLAGQVLIEKYQPRLAVCAYGHRAGYLAELDAPSESEVMSEMLAKRSSVDIEVWPRDRMLPIPSNTRKELLNIFDLALERGLKSIGIVTVGVHVPRTAVYVSKILSVQERYRALAPVVFESEEVLLLANRGAYEGRVQMLRDSQAYARNWRQEEIGILKIARDVYGDAKPAVIGVQ